MMPTGLDVLHVYSIGSSAITFLYDQPSPKRPSGPRHAVLSGFPVVPFWGPRLHVVNEEDNSVETWHMKYSSSNVSLTLQGSAVSTLSVPGEMNVSTAAELLISPNGSKYPSLHILTKVLTVNGVFNLRIYSRLESCCRCVRRGLYRRLPPELAYLENGYDAH